MQTVVIKAENQTTITKDYTWLEEPLEHEGYTLYWVSCEQIKSQNKMGRKQSDPENKKEVNRFIFIINIKPTGGNVREIFQAEIDGK